MQVSAKDKSQMWVSVGELLSGVEELQWTVFYVQGDLSDRCGQR